MASLTMRDVRKSFGQVHIIKGVDLDIRHGEFVVFVGPSGCGKSTLLRMIAGLEEISSGEMLIDDKVCNEVAPKDRGIAMVFQSYALYPHKTVYANMAFALEIAGFSKVEIAEKVQKAAKILHIEHLLDRKPGQLSGGQRQRVAIGRAIVREPKIFLFDEPLSNLDAALRVSTRAEIAKLHEDLGSTMIYVTHDQVEAMTLADKIVVLEAGFVRQVGAPLELYHRPQNLFVAGFIGSPKMNFITVQAKVVATDGITVEAADVPAITVPVDATGAVAGAEVTLGIRPEHIHLDGATGVPVTVDFVERLGHQTIVQAKRSSDDTILIAVLDGDVPVKAGQTTRFAFAATDCHLFNAEGNAFMRPAVAI
jgi:multiple sugar transport system ATP-binding protein